LNARVCRGSGLSLALPGGGTPALLYSLPDDKMLNLDVDYIEAEEHVSAQSD
jgi:hypothetical protein